MNRSIVALLLSLASSAFVASGDALSYRVYENNKSSGDDAFGFDANSIVDEAIVMDGIRDAAYGSSVLTYGPSSCVDVYTYHGEEALYFFFDVTDKQVTSRAIGNNNAQDEDGVEISIDRLIDGGTAAQLDDLRIYLGVSGYSKVIKGTGSGWDTSTLVGFGGNLVRSIKDNTTVNDNDNVDEGYCLEYRIPYISLIGDANKKTPFAFAFVHSGLEQISGSRTRTGLGGHKTLKIPNADIPNGYIILAPNGQFYHKEDYFGMSQALPSVLGRVTNKNGEPLANVSVEGYYASNAYRKFFTSTNQDGYFCYDEVETNDDFIVKASRNGLLPYQLTYSKTELSRANGAECLHEFVLLPVNAATSSFQGQIEAYMASSLSGFEVQLIGYPDTSATSDSIGGFAIPVYDDVQNTLLITKKGYEPLRLLVEGAMQTIEMYQELTMLTKPRSLDLAHNNAYVSAGKGKDGVLIKILSYDTLQGMERVEVGFNTGSTSCFLGHYVPGDYRLIVDHSGVSLLSYDVSQKTFVPSANAPDIVEKVVHDNLYETTLTVPYAALGVSASSTIGIASAFYNGQKYQDSSIDRTIAKDGEIALDSTATYLRFGSGEVRFGPNNLDHDFLYYYHGVDGSVDEDIPNNADRVYLSYDRDNNGLSLHVMIDDGFGTHFNPAYLTGIEALNLVLNLDNVNLSSWALYKENSTCYDVNLRIYSDDDICYINSTDVMNQQSNQLWWSDRKHSNGVAKNFTLDSHPLSEGRFIIDRENGYRVYHLYFTYAELLRMGNAPEGVKLTGNSPISIGVFELSETSKTTVRFYTTGSGNSWIYSNGVYINKDVTYSGQSTYISLGRNR